MQVAHLKAGSGTLGQSGTKACGLLLMAFSGHNNLFLFGKQIACFMFSVRPCAVARQLVW